MVAPPGHAWEAYEIPNPFPILAALRAYFSLNGPRAGGSDAADPQPGPDSHGDDPLRHLKTNPSTRAEPRDA